MSDLYTPTGPDLYTTLSVSATRNNTSTLMNDSSQITDNYCREFNEAYNTSDLSWKRPIYVTYYVCTSIMCILSIIGCMLILYYYYTIKHLQNRSRQLLINLTWCDLGIAFGNLCGIGVMIWGTYFENWMSLRKDPLNWFCQLQAVISSTFSLASFFWTSFLSANAYFTVRYNSKALAERYMWVVHGLSWSIPLSVTAIALGYQRYGYNPCVEECWWCWVSPKPTDQRHHLILWQLFTGKAWELISYVIVCTFCGAVRNFLSKHVRKITQRKASISPVGKVESLEQICPSYNLANKKLTYIPVVFMLSRIWGTLRFLILLKENDRTARYFGLALSPLQGIGDSAQGFLNCLVFITTTPCVYERFPCYGKAADKTNTDEPESFDDDSHTTYRPNYGDLDNLGDMEIGSGSYRYSAEDQRIHSVSNRLTDSASTS